MPEWMSTNRTRYIELLIYATVTHMLQLGGTALIYGAYYGHTDVVRALLADAKVDKNIRAVVSRPKQTLRLCAELYLGWKDGAELRQRQRICGHRCNAG